MKKWAEWIVKRRFAVLAVMLAAAALSLFLLPRVNVETNMSRYLPENSRMKQGMHIMEEAFPALATDSTIRVMFEGLPEAERGAVQDELAALSGVSRVEYEAGSAYYNKDGYTLYILHLPYDYRTPETEEAERQLTENFGGRFGMTYTVDDTSSGELPLWIVALAIVILMAILLVMCASWMEPFLFLFTIAAAVALNMGTNAFLPRVSQTTWSIAAILQLVLSMDYSIILMNRYRQELIPRPDRAQREQAMARALCGAFPAIVSSAVTTVVGLLALVFMSFQIGADIGVVLAKGVAISLLCVTTILPALILAFDGLIRRTAKKVIPLPMGGFGRWSYRLRWAAVAAFAVLFAALYLFKGSTKITYTMTEPNAVDAVFPKTTTIAMVYDERDDEAAAALTKALEGDECVAAVQSYANTIGRQNTAEEMADMMAALEAENGGMEASGQAPAGTPESGTQPNAESDGIEASGQDSGQAPVESGGTEGVEFDEAMLRFVYWRYHTGGQTGTLTLEQFLPFLEEMAQDERFGASLDAESRAALARMQPFSSKEELTRKRSAAELAEALGVEQRLTAGALVMTGQSEASVQEMLTMLADPQMQQKLATREMQAGAQADAAMMAQLQGTQASGQPDAAALAQMQGAQTSGQPDAALAQMQDAQTSGQTDADALAQMQGAQADGQSDAAALAQLKAAQALAEAVMSGQSYDAAGMAQLLGGLLPEAALDENAAALLYQLYGSENDYDPTWTMSAAELLSYVSDEMMEEPQYAALFGEEVRESVRTAQAQLAEAEKNLRNDGYALLSVTAALADESPETSAFLQELEAQADQLFGGPYYLIGAAPMVYEMEQTFTGEMNKITLLTFAGVFLVVMATFRSLLVPLLLGLLIQAAVYATMVVMGLRGGGMNYLALLIVQSILMGATIDYAILFTTYYREKRRGETPEAALTGAYSGSIHTILTSGLIMILVTWVLGYAFSDPSIGQICHTIALGATCSVLLILLILPGVLAAFDRWTRGKIAAGDR